MAGATYHIYNIVLLTRLGCTYICLAEMLSGYGVEVLYCTVIPFFPRMRNFSIFFGHCRAARGSNSEKFRIRGKTDLNSNFYCLV